MTLCNPTSFEAKQPPPAAPEQCRMPQADLAPLSMAERIAAFLDGRTRGDDLLHELYDYVLEEPIPQRMRDLLK